MSRKQTDWREELANYQVHTKAGRLKFLVDVIKAYELLYPGRFRYYLDAFRKLKQVKTLDGYTDAKGRKVWSDNIPTEPFLYVQRWIPKFGMDPDYPGDMALLKTAWEDFVCTPNRRRLKHSTFWKGKRNVTPQSQGKKAKLPVVDQGRPEEGDTGDREGIEGGEPPEHPDLGDADHTGRPGRAEEVSDIGEGDTPH